MQALRCTSGHFLRTLVPDLTCLNPDCDYVFPEGEELDIGKRQCPRCGRAIETARPTPPSLPPMELAPPDVPVSAAVLSQGIQQGLGTVGSAEYIPEAHLDIALGYYLLVNNRRLGPIERSKLLSAGLDHGTLVWFPGAKGWKPARNVDSLRDLLDYVPPPTPGAALWGNPTFLPRPKTYHVYYWWYFWTTLVGLFFLALMITFIILHESIRTFVGPDRFGRVVMTRNPVFEILAVFSGFWAFVFGVASVVLFLALLYQMWKAVQDGYVQTSPGAAVGLLFVPIFNLFWIFIAIYGLARECNRYIQRHGCPARPAPAGVALATCICALIPWVNVFTAIPLALITMAMLKNTAADIVDARLAEEAEGNDALARSASE